MERILRSVLTVGNQPEPDECLANWNRLTEHDLEFGVEEDLKIYEYLKNFYSTMSAPPDFSLVREYFEKQDDIETVNRLEEVKRSVFHIRTNFISIVRTEREQQTIRRFVLTCRDAQVIAEHGKNLDKPVNGKKVLRGTQDAINYIFGSMSELSAIETGEKLEGVVSDDSEDVLSEYEDVEKTNKFAGRNLFGLEPVDAVCQGHKSGEFWVHCAHPGELKTTLALNYAYNNAYKYGKSIFYAILEMPYKQLRRQLFVLHSSHGKFVTEWHEQDKRNGLKEPYLGLNYRSVRDGTLSPLEKERLKIVAQDFKATCKGKLYVWKPYEEVTVHDIKRKAEMFYNKYGCDGLVIDYLGKIKTMARSSSAVDQINNIVSDSRNVALNFARGKGVPLLALFQMNRQGKLRADKNDGVYDVASISYANRIMEDADVVSYTYLNQVLRDMGKFYMGCLKNRDNPPFDKMVGKILWNSKRIRALETGGLLDLNNDQLKKVAQAITLSTDDMIL